MPVCYRTNSSDEGIFNDNASTVILAIWGTILSVLTIIAILGNGVVIGTLLRTWSTAGTKPGNLLALVLAFWDLLHSTVNTVFVLVVAAIPCVAPAVMRIHFGLLVLLAGGSNLTLCVISLNRYYTVAKPNTNDATSRRRVKKFLIMALGLASTTAFVCMLMYDMGWNRDTPGRQKIPNGVPMLIAVFLVVLIPIVIMTVTYLRLFRLVKMRCQPEVLSNRPISHPPEVSINSPRNAAGQSNDNGVGRTTARVGMTNKPSGETKHNITADVPSIFGATTAPNKILVRQNRQMQGPPDLRIAITLLILLGVFILCWAPAIILVIANLAEKSNVFHPIALLVVTVAIFIVPACNPVVYSLRNSQFRVAANEFLDSIVNICRRRKT